MGNDRFDSAVDNTSTVMDRSISIIAGCFLLISCSSEEYELIEGTGIRGAVNVGDRDSHRSATDCQYEPYNGLLYFLVKADTDSHIANAEDMTAVIAHMKGHSYSTWVGYGNLNCQVPVGQYYLATRDDYNLSVSGAISIREGEMLDIEIIFNICPDP